MIEEFSFVKELTPGTLGIYGVLGVVTVALIKMWPVIQLQVIEAKAKLRQEKRDDLSDCQRQITALRGELDTVRDSVHQFEMKLLGAITAYRILDSEVEAHLPDSSALAQARAAMSAAFSLSPSTVEMPKELKQ